MHVYIITLFIVLKFLLPVNARNANSSTKAEFCKYFDSHRGCVRGAKCFYAHCEEESRKVEGAVQSHSSAAKQLKRKIFVGGLPPSVDSGNAPINLLSRKHLSCINYDYQPVSII